MQYTITINQYAVLQAGLDLDVVDMSIFDYIKHFSHSSKCLKLQTESGTFFWISHNNIIKELPILGINTGAGIVKRINKLIDAGLLIRHPSCDALHKTFYRFGPNYDRVIFTDNESLQPTTNVGGSENESCGSTENNRCGKQNTINKQSTIEQNIPADGGLFPSETGFENLIHTRRTSEPTACLFSNSRFADYNLFAAEFNSKEYEHVDVSYYFHAVADWSAQKGKKMKDWIATARNFMRSDKENGKLHLICGDGGLSADGLKYLQDMA